MTEASPTSRGEKAWLDLVVEGYVARSRPDKNDIVLVPDHSSDPEFMDGHIIDHERSELMNGEYYGLTTEEQRLIPGT